MTDIHLQAGPDGRGQVLVDGVDITRFVQGLGIDVTPERTKVVVEGTAKLEATLESVGVEVRVVPVLNDDDRRLLHKAAAAFDPGGPKRERYDRLVERLEAVAA